MQLTPKQIREIAAATKRICSSDGYGHQVLVWGDCHWSEAICSNSPVGLLNQDNSREYPIVRLCRPATQKQVIAEIDVAESRDI